MTKSNFTCIQCADKERFKNTTETEFNIQILECN